jgi:hypothetical protein
MAKKLAAEPPAPTPVKKGIAPEATKTTRKVHLELTLWGQAYNLNARPHESG